MKKDKDWIVLLAAVMLMVLLICDLQGCVPAFCVYKVGFENGTTEYFELNYKPAKGTKFIEYNGETFMGVTSIERVK